MISAKLKYIGIILLCSLLIPSISAECECPLMMVPGALLAGSVMIYNENAYVGTVIEAYAAGGGPDCNTSTSEGIDIVITEGAYGLMAITGCFLNEEITFKINGLQASQIYYYSSADIDTNFDLSVDCTDSDDDGYSPEGAGCGLIDCDDDDADVNPGESEICNGIDDDCDDSIDEELTQACGTGNCQGTQTCTAGVWGDCSSEDTDCGVCAICDGTGTCVYDENQDNDCSDTICPDDCDLIPDDDPFTWDYANDVSNECVDIGTCSQNQCTYDHECSVAQCSAECDETNPCAATDCDYLDGCAGYDYHDYDDVSNDCLGDCTCEQNQCSQPAISYDDAYCFDQLNISLKEGWNLISIPLLLDIKTVENAFEGISYSKIFTYADDEWHELDNNSLINKTKGYWINSLNNQTLIVKGKELNDTTFNLNQGWNLIGYLSLTIKPINETFNVSQIYSVLTYNNGVWYSYNPDRLDVLNTLKQIKPGYGYWVYSNENATIT